MQYHSRHHPRRYSSSRGKASRERVKLDRRRASRRRLVRLVLLRPPCRASVVVDQASGIERGDPAAIDSDGPVLRIPSSALGKADSCSRWVAYRASAAAAVPAWTSDPADVHQSSCHVDSLVTAREPRRSWASPLPVVSAWMGPLGSGFHEGCWSGLAHVGRSSCHTILLSSPEGYAVALLGQATKSARLLGWWRPHGDHQVHGRNARERAGRELGDGRLPREVADDDVDKH